MCPGTQCRTIYDNIIVACAGVPSIDSLLNELRQALDVIDQQVAKFGYRSDVDVSLD